MQYRLGWVVASLFAFGCVAETEPVSRLSGLEVDAFCAADASPNNQHLVVTNPAILRRTFGSTEFGRFSLRRVLSTIAQSSNTRVACHGDLTLNRECLLEQVLAPNADTTFTQPLSGLEVPATARPNEAEMSPRDLMDQSAEGRGLVPLALFNRFDLAPEDGAHCGEFRIVYGRPNASNDRYFMIFEAALANPKPKRGLEGCRDYIESVWLPLQSLNFADANDALTASKLLEEFYFYGTRVQGKRLPAVVRFQNYGLPFGQIRTNGFVQTPNRGGPWELREYRTHLSTAGLAEIIAAPTAASPVPEFYTNDTSTPALFADAAHFLRERDAFQRTFVDVYLGNLASPELNNETLTARSLPAKIEAGFEPHFNDFTSNAQSSVDNPSRRASATFTSSVDGELTQLFGDDPGALTTAMIFNRAGALSCGGCHQFSNNQTIWRDAEGDAIRWPRSAGFVHVRESGQLSSALNTVFLPNRDTSMRQALCHHGSCQGSCGDATGDGTVDADDARALILHVINRHALEGCDASLADVDGDGDADIHDFLKLRRHLNDANTESLDCDGPSSVRVAASALAAADNASIKALIEALQTARTDTAKREANRALNAAVHRSRARAGVDSKPHG